MVCAIDQSRYSIAKLLERRKSRIGIKLTWTLFSGRWNIRWSSQAVLVFLGKRYHFVGSISCCKDNLWFNIVSTPLLFNCRYVQSWIFEGDGLASPSLLCSIFPSAILNNSETNFVQLAAVIMCSKRASVYEHNFRSMLWNYFFRFCQQDRTIENKRVCEPWLSIVQNIYQHRDDTDCKQIYIRH